MTEHQQRVRALAAIVVLLVGCPDSSESAGHDDACSDEFRACGGDVRGTWEADEICTRSTDHVVVDVQSKPECKGLVRGVTGEVSGSYDFRADGQVESDLMVSFTLEIAWRSACVSAVLGRTVTLDSAQCDKIKMAYDADAGFSKITCQFQNDVCNCAAIFDAADKGLSAYSVMGDSLHSDSDNTDTPYCVEADTLRVNMTDTETGIEQILVLHRKH